MKRQARSFSFAGTLALASPLPLYAHPGHAGDHGWLAGALQPLLAPDHFLAGVFVALVLTLGIAVVGPRRGETEERARR